MNTTQPFEVDQVGPAPARVYRLETEDDVELAITRLGSEAEAEENTGEPVILVHGTFCQRSFHERTFPG
jgi:hypothetical protein